MVVEPWIDGLWDAIKEAISKMTSERPDCVKEEEAESLKETSDPSKPDIQLNLLSLDDSQNCESGGQARKTDSKFANTISFSASTPHTAVSDVRPVSSAGNIGLASQASGAVSVYTSGPETQTGDAEITHIALAASLTYSLLPLSGSALNVPLLPPPYLHVSLQEAETTAQVKI